MNKQMQRWMLGGFAVALLAAAGCGGERTLPKKETQAIQGKLLHKGEPMQFVLVTLEPVDPSKGAQAHGVTAEDGTFSLRTYSNTDPDGVVPGEYKVVLEQHNPVEGGPVPKGAKPTPITPELANPDLTVAIAEGQDEVTIEVP